MNKLSNEVINMAILNSKMLGEDFIETYIPFVSTLISKKQYEEFDVQKVCEDFYSEYSFKIPAMPMTEILNRMVIKKILKKNFNKKLIPNYDKIVEMDFNEVSRDNLMKFENIKNRYISYASEKYEIQIEDIKAEENLCDFVKENYIETIMNEEYIRGMNEGLDNNYIKNDIYVLYKFVIHLYENEYENFKIIKNFCLGYTIANALSFDNISSNNKNFKEKNIFFDTKFILRALGVEGEFYKNSYQSIIEILKENNCHLYVLENTYDEIIEILKNAKESIDRSKEFDGNIPLVQRYFMEKENSSGDIKYWIACLKGKITDLGIYISKIQYIKETDKYQIDEKALYDKIVETYKSRNHNFDEENKRETINRDIKSIALIYRELRENRPKTIETAKIFFVTTNKALAYACKNFNKELGKREGISPCITDIFLGTILWFQNPVRYDELKENQLIANCYAAIRPTAMMLNKFSKEIDNLKNNNQITKYEYYLLKNYEVTDSMLSDKTMGNIENVNENTTYEILNEIKFEMKKDVVEQLNEEINKNKKVELEKNEIQAKYDNIIEEVKKQSKKKVKIKKVFNVLRIIIIPIILVCIEMVFNILEIKQSMNKIIRIFVYIGVTIYAIVDNIRKKNEIDELEKKEYNKLCKKYGINDEVKK